MNRFRLYRLSLLVFVLTSYFSLLSPILMVIILVSGAVIFFGSGQPATGSVQFFRQGYRIAVAIEAVLIGGLFLVGYVTSLSDPNVGQDMAPLSILLGMVNIPVLLFVIVSAAALLIKDTQQKNDVPTPPPADRNPTPPTGGALEAVTIPAGPQS